MMYTVVINTIGPQIGKDMSVTIRNEHEMFESRHAFRCIDDQHQGPYLVRLIKEIDDVASTITISHICYNGDMIYRFAKREIERDAIAYGMHAIFNN